MNISEINTKFNVGQIVYTIKDQAIDRVHYGIINFAGREMEYSEALLVSTIEEAKQAAKTNWETIDSNVRQLLDKISDANFDERQKMYNEKVNEKKRIEANNV
jgi:ABC-type dipeptide/oligopeptide/nickel transport system ATPase component